MQSSVRRVATEGFTASGGFEPKKEEEEEKKTRKLAGVLVTN